MTRLLVIAKAPAPNVSKTRLCPPCTPEQAALLAEASLIDTLQTVLSLPSVRPILVLDGDPGSWLPNGIEVISQRGSTLNERLAAAFEDAAGPSFLIGMDTPQVTGDDLRTALETMRGPGVDAVLGLADDGGWWGLGLKRAVPGLFHNIPMSEPDTGSHQLGRLRELGLSVELLRTLRDVDVFSDAQMVAAQIPMSRFAKEVRELAGIADR